MEKSPSARGFLLAFVCGLWTMRVFAATNYVDCKLGDYSGHDGSSWANAFETIQEGVDAAQPGDVVLVAPGDYVKGGKADTLASGGHFNRVFIERKAITLKAYGARGETRIVGEVHEGAAFGLGADAVRCVAVVADSAAEAPVIEGFDIVSGATDCVESSKDCARNIGGGVLVCSSAGTRSLNAFVVDCRISGCAATRGGGGNGGCYVRCRITDCDSSAGNGAGLRNASLYNCLITGNATRNPAAPAVGYVLDGAAVVNCTFSGNAGKVLGDHPGTVRNCIFSENGDVILVKHGDHNADYSHCLVDKGGALLTETCIRPTDNLQLFAPARGDYRPLPTSLAVAAGDVDALESIPAEYRDKDIDGNPRVSGDTVNMGCYETVSPAPAGGALIFYFRASVNGFEGACSGLHAYTETYPEMLDVKCVPGAYTNDTIRFYGNSGEVDSYDRWYPKWDDGRVGLIPPPSSFSGIVRLGADKTLWVDADASVDGSDGSEEKPYKTIQEAVVAAADEYTVIKVRPGTYETGVGEGGDDAGQYNRVAVGEGQDIRIVSTDGPSVTEIVGKAVVDGDSFGCGSGSVRCIYLGGASVVQGFTLTGGRAANYSGGVYAVGDTSVLTDCIITNCVSPRAAAARRGRFERCWFTDNFFSNTGNKEYNSVVEQGIYSACVFSANRAPDQLRGHPIAGIRGWMYHCSGIGDGRYYITDSNIVQVNCVWDSYLGVSVDSGQASTGGYYIDSQIYDNRGQFVPTVSPLARNLPYCRLFADSPAVWGGTSEYSDYFKYATLDYEGKTILFTNGLPTAGAFRDPAPSAIASASGTASGGISNEGTNSVGLVSGDTVTFSALKAGRRPVVGMRVNGELITNVTSYAWTVPELPCYTPFYVEAVYGTNWYVDAVNGDNANNGSYPHQARKTLESVLTNAIPGDVVTAAPGRYNEGTMLHSPLISGSSVIRSRAVVPEGVTLRSSAGAKSTFITGASATSPTDEYGNGPDAVRGVFLEADARLCGFTVTGGRTDHDPQKTSESDMNRGGGVYCASDDRSVVEDCVISNNVALRGGGGYKGTYSRCRITGNHATINGTAARNAYFSDCFIDGNTGNGETVYIFWSFANCTFGPENFSEDGKAGLFGFNGSRPPSSPVVNSVILSGKLSGAVYVSNTLYAAGVTLSSIGTALGNTCRQVPEDELRFDEAGRPVYGHCAAIDFGDASLRPASAGGYDVDGGQRVFNGAVDAGCCEFDWRGKYAAALGRSSVAVSEVSPEVVLNEENKAVRLSDGCRMQVEPSPMAVAGKYCEVRVTVTGSGVLSVMRDGVAVCEFTAGGSGTYPFVWGDFSDGLDLAFAGDGHADVFRCGAVYGTVLTVR